MQTLITSRADEEPAALSGQSGMAMFVVTLALAALAVLGLTVFTSSTIDLSITRHFKTGTEALYQADAGVQYVLERIQDDLVAKTLTLNTGTVSVSYSAPSGFQFDTVTNIVPLADRKSYWYQVTGRSLDSRATLEAIFQKVDGFPFGLFGEDRVDISSSSEIHANAGSNGDISLTSGALVDGNATPGPGESVSVSGSTVTGSTAPNSALVVLDPVDPVALAAAMASNNNGALPANVRSGTELQVQSGETFTMPAGTYYFTKMNIEDDIRLSGPVVIYCTGTITIKSGSEVNKNTANADNLRIYCTSSGNILIDSSSYLYGHLYAPNASNTEIKSSSRVFGSVITGGRAFVDSSSQFTVQGSFGKPAGVKLLSWKQAR